MSITSQLAERILVLDGAMGTEIFKRNPTADDFGGPQQDGCPEVLNVTRPDWIREIHTSYLAAGADAVETNTFGANPLVLAEYGLAERTEELNEAAVRLARAACDAAPGPRFVVGSVGPGTRLLSLGQIDYSTLYQSYLKQMNGLLSGGVDVVLIETCQDLGQMKLAVRAARDAMRTQRRSCPIWVQATMETMGTTLTGSDVQAILTSLEPLAIQALGFNCGTGPDEMAPHVQALARLWRGHITLLPNAGLPQNHGGQLVYPQSPEEFACKVADLARICGVNVVGGCCGTTPAHIAALALAVKALPLPKRAVEPGPRHVASLYGAVSLAQTPPPLIIGERTNANGSKNFRELLLKNDFAAMVDVARSQAQEGAHVLDVCVAYAGRNEARDMVSFLKDVVTQVALPLMIDSTDPDTLEKALQMCPGKAIVNSINFEDGEKRALHILELCKTYGAAVVGLTIDERGMARRADEKLRIAARLVELAVDRTGIHPGDLIIDPLTFTLGSGDADLRDSAKETLTGIRRIKAEYPQIGISLGLSNISFGLSPYARQIINSVFLTEALKAGMDMAILNTSRIIPLDQIDVVDRQLAEDLIFDRRPNGQDPLKEMLTRFESRTATPQVNLEQLNPAERLHEAIVRGERTHLQDDLNKMMESKQPLEIVNSILLPAMGVVGERFAAGTMQLPFVLGSAETMKACMEILSPHMPATEGPRKGKVLLATVKGDVHDIGKNLVDIILSTNGFDVINLGIKQPIEAIIKAIEDEAPDAIGLSGLLVKSTLIMREDLQLLAEKGYTIPVMLGGAALTPEFVYEHCRPIYRGPVIFAKDAFDGLNFMESLAKRHTTDFQTAADEATANLLEEPELQESLPQSDSDRTVRVLKRGNTNTELNQFGQSSWVRTNVPVPTPPFWGTQIQQAQVADLFSFLDEFALVRHRWGFSQGSMSDRDFKTLLETKVASVLEQWKGKLKAEKLLDPQGVVGYFPANSDGDTLIIYAPGSTASQPREHRTILAKIPFPRQSTGRRLCIADFFRHVESGELDVVGLLIASMGELSEATGRNMFVRSQFTDYFYFHGLSTEFTEAYAERVHAQIRASWGIGHRDAPNKEAIFRQGYQGSRYSFGYPACPDLAGNQTIIDLLGADRIGIKLTETLQMNPEHTTCALICHHPQARYFAVHPEADDVKEPNTVSETTSW